MSIQITYINKFLAAFAFYHYYTICRVIFKLFIFFLLFNFFFTIEFFY